MDSAYTLTEARRGDRRRVAIKHGRIAVDPTADIRESPPRDLRVGA